MYSVHDGAHTSFFNESHANQMGKNSKEIAWRAANFHSLVLKYESARTSHIIDELINTNQTQNKSTQRKKKQSGRTKNIPHIKIAKKQKHIHESRDTWITRPKKKTTHQICSISILLSLFFVWPLFAYLVLHVFTSLTWCDTMQYARHIFPGLFCCLSHKNFELLLTCVWWCMLVPVPNMNTHSLTRSFVSKRHCM